MQTKTLKLDFSQFRDKKSSSLDEMRGIRKNHPVKELKTNLQKLEKIHKPSEQYCVNDDDTYLSLVKKALHYLTWCFGRGYIVVNESDPVYEITYSTHDEPKEYFMGMYIGKTTGNLYFSNTGDDIIFGTVLDFVNVEYVINLIRGIQIFKITGKLEDLHKYMFLRDELETSKTNTSKSSYVDIFNRSNTSSVQSQNTKNINFPKYDYYEFIDYVNAILNKSIERRVIIQAIKVLSLMLSHGVGRISSVSPETEEILTDFNKTSLSTRIDDLSWLTTNVRSSRESIINNMLMMSTEYLTVDPDDMHNGRVEKIPRDELLAYTFKSLVDNTDSERITLYSQGTVNIIAGKLEIPHSAITNLRTSVLALDKKGYVNIFKPDTNKFMSSGITLGASNLMFQSSKIGYKYLQRLHSILERLA